MMLNQQRSTAVSRIMGRSRYKITEPEQAHFVTLTVLHWIPAFTHPDTVNILLDSLRFLSKDGLKIYAWVILENHCHFVLQSNALDQATSGCCTSNSSLPLFMITFVQWQKAPRQ